MFIPLGIINYMSRVHVTPISHQIIDYTHSDNRMEQNPLFNLDRYVTKLTGDLEAHAMFLHQRDTENYVNYMQELKQLVVCDRCVGVYLTID